MRSGRRIRHKRGRRHRRGSSAPPPPLSGSGAACLSAGGRAERGRRGRSRAQGREFEVEALAKTRARHEHARWVGGCEVLGHSPPLSERETTGLLDSSAGRFCRPTVQSFCARCCICNLLAHSRVVDANHAPLREELDLPGRLPRRQNQLLSNESSAPLDESKPMHVASCWPMRHVGTSIQND